ncbi:hypothetical protein P9112_014105 [Eukaryota sp. TZLM1-RC]
MADRYSDDLYLQIEEFERDKRKIERQIFEERERAKHLQTEVDNLHAQIKSVTEREQTLLNSNHELKAILQSHQDEHIQLQTELKKARAQIAYFMEQTENERSKCKTAQKDFAQKLEQINSKLAEYHEYYSSQTLAKTLETVQKEKRDLEIQLNRLSNESNTADLQREIADCQDRNEKLQAETNELKSHNESLLTEQQNLVDQIQNLKEELSKVNVPNHDNSNTSESEHKSQLDEKEDHSEVSMLKSQLSEWEKVVNQSTYAIDLIHDNVCEACQEIVKAALEQAQEPEVTGANQKGDMQS